MKLFTRFAILFYVSIVLFLGCALLTFALQWLSVDFISVFLTIIYVDDTSRWVLGIIAGILLLVNFLFYQFFSINAHREKIIAFYNPYGRVTVSLFAIEDLVKGMILGMPEIKEAKASIKALKKKGLRIRVRLILRGEVNIPDMTEKIQELVQNKVQDITGITDPITVEIYIGKFSLEKTSGKMEREELRDELEPHLPFKGYRA